VFYEILNSQDPTIKKKSPDFYSWLELANELQKAIK